MTRLDRSFSLSIVILAFNEEQTIARVVEEHLSFGQARLNDFEIIVVDDGSTDATARLVEKLAAKDERVGLLQHGANRGMGAAMRTGIQGAHKNYLVFNAADGQVPATEIGKLVALWRKADIVLSTYTTRRETLVRELLSRGLRVYLQLVAGIKFELEGLYLYPTQLAKELEPFSRAETFFFSFELIQRALDRGLTTTNTELVLRARDAGSSKVARLKRIERVAREALDYGWRRRLDRVALGANRV